ncbi:MAG TPA: tetratricopeptide repeat protein [Thermoanaerobaculia bacterium]|nr:tetratricopeptide repeat protein [Thermoanaerobaculia bacterium]
MDERTHPEPEALAAFLEGSLSGSDLGPIAEHLGGCEECRLVIGEAAAFLREESPDRTQWRGWVRWTTIAAAAATVAGVLVLSPLRDRFRDPLDELQPRDHRAIQARLTEFDYAPYRVTRGGEESADRPTDAAAELEERLRKRRTPENLHRFALAQLALGQPARAKSLLEEAVRAEPDNAAILSDLAAAQFATGDYAVASETAARALRLDPSLSAAAFNLALSLEAAGKTAEAVDAWQNYLRFHSGSRWDEEARDHLDRLGRRKR